MSKHTPCNPYVWEDPKVLLRTGLLWRSHETGPCASEIVNQIILLYSLAFLAGTVITMAVGSNLAMTVSIGAATLFSLPSFWALIHLRSKVVPAAQASPKKEGFQTDAAVPDGVYHVIGSGAAPAANTLPTARNPFMNVLLDEIKYNPSRPDAAPVNMPAVKQTLNDYFRVQWFSDPTDVFGKNQSQRQFVTQPSTTVPNDQGAFADWLYRIPGKTCKEGGREIGRAHV